MIRQQRGDELERFKQDINLVEYVQNQGYELIKSESSRASAVLRRGEDKIIVATDQDGHGIYFSVRDDADNGTVIDFVQRRTGANLGQVRKELRGWCPSSPSYRPPAPEAPRPRKPEPSSADRAQVLARWIKMAAQPTDGHPYLRQRAIDTSTLMDPRFAGHIRIDARGNAVFPHYDLAGICGYELKNQDFTGFSKNGEKGIWLSANISSAPRVVVVESAIDALSHAQITGDREAAYLSIAGAMSDKQRALLSALLQSAHTRGAEIIIGTDADAAGAKLAVQVSDLVPAGAKPSRAVPGRDLKDWNDELTHKPELKPKLENGLDFGM